MALVRLCGVCGAKVAQGQRCACQKKRHREYDSTRRNQEYATFYSSAAWKRVAESVRARAGYADEYILYYEKRLAEGRLVHHIFPVEERPDLKLSLMNMVCVSSKTHERIHTEYKAGGRRKAAMQKKLLAVREHSFF